MNWVDGVGPLAVPSDVVARGKRECSDVKLQKNQIMFLENGIRKNNSIC